MSTRTRASRATRRIISPPDAVRIAADDEGRPLIGEHRYMLRFEEGQLPPVGVVWSVTMHDEKQAPADNPIHRHAIGGRDPLTRDDDGSLTIYLQHASPGSDRVPNWLPAPTGAFSLSMRVHWPKSTVRDGAWAPPQVTRVD